MKIYKLETTVFNKLYSQLFSGYVFHNLLDNNFTKFKFITKSHEKQFLEILSKNNIAFELIE